MKSGLTAASHAVLSILAGWAITVSAASAATDPGVRGGAPGAGDPVPGLSKNETTLFFDGQATFAEVDAVGDGLGPRFNLDSCLGCHSFPVHGGSAPPVNPQATVALAMGAKNTLPPFITANGPIREARLKFQSNGQRDGGVHSLFVVSGRVDSSGSAAKCTAVQEDFAGQAARGNVSFRIPTPTYGLGLVESIPDTALTANLATNARAKSALGISGHLNTNGNDGRVARFGWKAQNVSLLLFSGEAYNVEMGITNELFPTERDLNPNCQTKAVPNDTTGQEGLDDADATLSDIEKFALYMRLLGAPIPSTTAPGGAASIQHGQQVFNTVGCSMCHTPSLTTATTTVQALSNKTVNLYSDLALHHMGPTLADNVIQGAAGPDEFRTAPLWGVGKRVFFLHDGRTKDIQQAILLHASGGWRNGAAPAATDATVSADATANWGGSASTSAPSEANAVIANYNALPDASKQDLLNFLRSL